MVIPLAIHRSIICVNNDRDVLKDRKYMSALFNDITIKVPVPVAERCKVKFCGRSPAEIAGSNPTGSMDVCLL
jgi:hypothetical protein